MQMSGRKGIYVDADYVLDTLHSKAKEEIIKRNPEITGADLEGTSEEIAISAMRYSLIKNDLEKEIKFLSKFSIVIEDTIKNMEPKLIAQYAYDLATIFNLFYEKLPILKEKNADISNTRICLVEAIRLMLEMNLSLIGITPLERM